MIGLRRVAGRRGVERALGELCLQRHDPEGAVGGASERQERGDVPAVGVAVPGGAGHAEAPGGDVQHEARRLAVGGGAGGRESDRHADRVQRAHGPLHVGRGARGVDLGEERLERREARGFDARHVHARGVEVAREPFGPACRRVAPGRRLLEEHLQPPPVGGAPGGARAPARLPLRDGVRGQPAGVGIRVEVGARIADHGAGSAVGANGRQRRREDQEPAGHHAIPRHEPLPASARSVRVSITSANSPCRSESAIACTSSAG